MGINQAQNTSKHRVKFFFPYHSFWLWTTIIASNGYYRNAWLLDPPNDVEFVYKRLKQDFAMNYWDMHKIHKEAIIMERLSASPRIVGIYGYCSTTILAEAMGSEVRRDIIPGTGRISQEELDQLDDVYPRNNFSSREKLDMSLEMAEAIADVHGFEGGDMLHGDIHPEQWLRAKDGRLVLNDFNNAEILDFAPSQGTYCKEYRNYGGFVSTWHDFFACCVCLCLSMCVYRH